MDDDRKAIPESFSSVVSRARDSWAQRHYSPEPVSLAGILREVVARFAPTASGASDLSQVEGIWSSVVGEEVSRWTQVTSYRAGVLVVRVTSAPLLAELKSFGMPSLLDGLSDAGLAGVHRLQLVSG